MTDALIHALKWLAGLAGVALASIAGFWTDLGSLLPWLLLVTVLDIASGLTAAWRGGAIDSRIAWRGMTRKVYQILLVVVAQIIEVVYRELVGPPPVDFSNWCAAFFIIVEAISVMENAGRAGAPIPPWLRDALALLNGKVGGGGAGP